MIIICPQCGPREISEYTYVGDATSTRPDHNDVDMEKWVNYVFMRKNPRGSHTEHWQHTAGCRAFLRVSRDTVTHEITGVIIEGPWQMKDK